MKQDNFYQNKYPVHPKDDGKSDIVPSSLEKVGNLDADSDDWQIVDFPNTLSIQSILGTDPNTTHQPMDNPNSENRLSLSENREEELLTLIRDLNECNDVLLHKVSQLEEALDRSQNALQAEVDYAQISRPAGEGQVRTSDRQIAKLVTELELSNQGLQRQQILNETLQAELIQYREKANHFEHECTRLQQTHTDQSQALAQAEADCRDLRARLQRQQRYTLQFKVALEKCLNVSAESRSHNFMSAPETQSPERTVSMPRAEDIQPWASEGGYNKLDPQLEAMIRHSKAPLSQSSTSSSPSPFTQQTPERINRFSAPPVVESHPVAKADPRAEAQLWQDLARVIDPPEGGSVDIEAESSIYEMNEGNDGLDLTFAQEHAAKANLEPQPMLSSPTEIQFTDRSPWDTVAESASTQSERNVSVEVLSEAQKVAVAVAQQHAKGQANGHKAEDVLANELAYDAYVPAMSMNENDPSPRVAPLKPQRKIKSLAAVDLPSFPKIQKQA